MARHPARRTRALIPRRTVIAALVVLAATAVMASAERRVRSAGAYLPGTRVFVADAVLSPLDIPGLIAPVGIVRTRRGAVVLDGATRRLVRLDPVGARADRRSDTTVVPWRTPVLADGGGRFRGADVLDVAGAALHHVPDAAGAPVRRSLRAASAPMAGCLLDDGTTMLLTEGVADALTAIGPDGRVRWRRPLPWPEVEHRSSLVRQGFMVAGADGRSCVVALAFGPGWAWIDRHGAVRTMGAWLDRSPPPTVREVPGGTRLVRGVPVVHGATVRADTLEVVAAGPTGLALRTVDRFSLSSAAYLGSVRLPRPTGALMPVEAGWIALAMRGGRHEPVRLTVRRRPVGFGGPER